MTTTTETQGKLYTVNFQKGSGKPGAILFRMPHLGCDPSELTFQFSSQRGNVRQVIYTFADEGEALFSDLEQAALACVSELRQIMAALNVSDLPLEITYRGRVACYRRSLWLRLNPSQETVLRDSLLTGGDPDFRYSGFVNSVALVVLVMRLTQLRGCIAEELGLDSAASTQEILQVIEAHIAGFAAAPDAATTGGAFADKAQVRTKTVRKIRTQHLALKILQNVKLGSGAFGCVSYNEDPVACEQELGIPRTLTTLVTCLDKLLRKHCEIDSAKQFLEELPAEIKPGADLSKVWVNFVAELILDNEHGLMAILGYLPDRNRRPRQAALEEVAAMFTQQCVRPDRWRQRAANLKKFDENNSVGAMNCVRELACLLAALPTPINMGALPEETVERFIVSITQRIGYHYRQVSGDFSDEYGADIYYCGIYQAMCTRLLKLVAAAPTVS